MFGWKAKWGYHSQGLFGNLNIGNITWTDESVMVFPTKWDLPIDAQNLLPPPSTASSFIHEGSLAIYESAMGQTDFVLLSFLVTMDYNDAQELKNISLYFPSIKVIAPNLFNYLISPRDSSKGTVVFIPGLQKYIAAIGGSTGKQCTIFNSDGTKLVASSIFPKINTNAPGGFPVYKFGIIDRDNLVKLDNWLYVGINSFTNRYYTTSLTDTAEDSLAKVFLQHLFTDYSPPDYDIPDNPYEPGGESGEGGGGGTFDDESDQIGDSTLPTISSANTGFTRIYNPTLPQVQALAQYLWTDESVIQTIWNHIKQYFENPMEAMIGFNLVPVTVPDGGTTTFKLMYIDTGVSMTAAANQFVDTDCGTLTLEPYYGSALDYSPYTKVSIFLPYIGMVSVDTDEVMGRTLQVKYRTDICSGACVAKILVDGNVLYQYTGHCAINIPFSAADFSSYVSAVMSTAKLAGTLALGASGSLGPVSVSEITQQTGEAITKTVTTERNPETGRQITTSSKIKTSGPTEMTTTKASYAGISPANVTNTVGEVISSKPHVEHSGSFSGTSGYLGIRRPYVIIKRPNMCMPSNYQSLNGFPCMITLKLGDCKGFTRVQQVVLSKMGKATNPEQAEILGLLKNGVIL